jgi:hypothetical protein
MPTPEMEERLQSSSHVDIRRRMVNTLDVIDERRYNSAKWWRNLNRVMSIVGLLVIGAIVALAVVGVKQRWST